MSRLKALVAKVISAVSGQVHEEKMTLSVDVYVPGHADRVTTPLFTKTRLELLAQSQQRCWICNRTAEEAGQPLEAHHLGIERSFAEGSILWDLVKLDFPQFDWSTFDPKNPYAFVDDMMAQGLILCKEHHTGEDTGIHYLPYPLWRMQRYLAPGYKFSPNETIVHDHT